MIISTCIFAFVAAMIALRSRALRISARIEAGTFAGLAAEIERVCAQGVQQDVQVDNDNQPVRRAA